MKLRPAWHLTGRVAAKSALFAVGIGLAVVGLWFLSAATMPRSLVPPEQGMHLSARILGSDWNMYYEADDTRSNSVYLLLLEAARAEHIPVTWDDYTIPPDAVLVTSIGHDVNGDGGRWWQYWVNGVYGSVAATHAFLNDGDSIEWRFAPFPP